jgi:hypothetical protein
MKKFIDLTNHSLEFSNTAKSWAKDLVFCKDESRFLENLFDDYDLHYSANCYAIQLKSMKSQLAVLVKTIDQISSGLQEQMDSLKLMMKGVVIPDFDGINDRQHIIEDSIFLLNQNMRKLKNALFAFVESAERSEDGFLN